MFVKLETILIGLMALAILMNELLKKVNELLKMWSPPRKECPWCGQPLNETE